MRDRVRSVVGSNPTRNSLFFFGKVGMLCVYTTLLSSVFLLFAYLIKIYVRNYNAILIVYCVCVVLNHQDNQLH